MAQSYLALGDSYSIGEAVPEAGRWPVQLAAGLRARGVELASPRIIATTGWTTDELALALDLAEPLGDWDFVSLLIGVNNQYRGRSAAQYAGEYRQLLERTIGYARGRPDRVLALSIPDWGATPFGARDKRGAATIGAELDVFNITAGEICARHGVAFVDIAPLSRELVAQPAMLADDGLHPSAQMYARWTELALPVAEGLLRQG
ncbi:GDSL-like Lipase/Acylhydrolase [Lysobacter enzymogenes]|uniref:GDSL-like Lipase/Acylhydrolase n=1 Tax=Lysobacter enzymogenes TaxID=69 RepID=A0A0S2DNI1_LYSEN|nr:SGNH/GDSL hydrolase family protein [Lysobacter enzymogenes]ALN60130.1 GDSL-like Lipase/Acylhydrolase [Lysobacter enzymogenes]QCW28139.1 SGNH/GDSL hydrolase family protein [Lysobacter enzymogenes]